MAYLGLVPSEHSSGPKRHIGGITKSGDIHARTLLIEAAHSYRLPARVARQKMAAVDAVPEAVRGIAWKAQTRLCQRYRHMMAKGKLRQIVVTAIARELAGFVWAIACITSDPPAKTSAAAPVSAEIGAASGGIVAVSSRNGAERHNKMGRSGMGEAGQGSNLSPSVVGMADEGAITHVTTDPRGPKK